MIIIMVTNSFKITIFIKFAFANLDWLKSLRFFYHNKTKMGPEREREMWILTIFSKKSIMSCEFWRFFKKKPSWPWKERTNALIVAIRLKSTTKIALKAGGFIAVLQKFNKMSKWCLFSAKVSERRKVSEVEWC